MKISIWHLVICMSFSAIIFSCRPSKNELPCIDLRKNYLEKEILLTDIADISYLSLNSDNDDYLYLGSIRDITENTIVIADYSKGDILFFSKDGIPKSRFNRRGNGPEEYLIARRIFYNETTDDVFVVEDSKPFIRVYSSIGKHKRDIPLPHGVRINNDIVSFDDCSFFFYDAGMEFLRAKAENNKGSLEHDYPPLPFYRISKKDGAVLDYLELFVTPIFLGLFRDGTPVSGIITRLTMGTEGVLLCNPENDTVFLYRKDKSLTPVLHKTPLVGSTNQITYMNNCIDVGRYQFTEIYTVRFEEGTYPFPAKYYMRDKSTGELVHPKLILPDYKESGIIISPKSRNVINNICYFELDLIELKQAYRENRLSGKLKELVATLKEDDNNVFMMVRFK